MKLICSIATIIERAKAQKNYTHIQAVLGMALFVEQTQKLRYESG